MLFDDEKFRKPTRPVRTSVRMMKKLARFVAKLPDTHFDFRITRRSCGISDDNECGTIGCLMGWSPNVFPDLLSYRGADFHLPPHSKHCVAWYEAGAMLLGIPVSDSYNIFTPNKRSPVDGSILGDSATAKQAAARLLQYANWYEHTQRQKRIKQRQRAQHIY